MRSPLPTYHQEAGQQRLSRTLLVLLTWAEGVLALATGRQLEGICVVSPDRAKSLLIFTCGEEEESRKRRRRKRKAWRWQRKEKDDEKEV